MALVDWYVCASMQDFTKLKMWRKAHDLALEVYRFTHGFPKQELYALTRQMRRSATSIPTNIAEGCGRNSPGDFKRFLAIASGSASELEYQLLLARDLQLLPRGVYEELRKRTREVKRMISGFSKKLTTDN